MCPSTPKPKPQTKIHFIQFNSRALSSSHREVEDKRIEKIEFLFLQSVLLLERNVLFVNNKYVEKINQESLRKHQVGQHGLLFDSELSQSTN